MKITITYELELEEALEMMQPIGAEPTDTETVTETEPKPPTNDEEWYDRPILF